MIFVKTRAGLAWRATSAPQYTLLYIKATSEPALNLLPSAIILTSKAVEIEAQKEESPCPRPHSKVGEQLGFRPMCLKFPFKHSYHCRILLSNYRIMAFVLKDREELYPFYTTGFEKGVRQLGKPFGGGKAEVGGKNRENILQL